MVSVCIETTPASEQSFFWKAKWESSLLSTLHSTSLSSIQSCNRHRLSSFLESTVSGAAGLSSLCCSRKAEKINISMLRVLTTACAVSFERHHMGIPGSQDPVAHPCGCFYALLCCSASAVWFQYLHFGHSGDLFASTCSHLRPSHCSSSTHIAAGILGVWVANFL